LSPETPLRAALDEQNRFDCPDAGEMLRPAEKSALLGEPRNGCFKEREK